MRISFFSGVVTVVLLAGCVSSQSGLVLAPVGPAAAEPELAGSQGALRVFSAYDVNAPNSGEYADIQRHADYKIFAANGKLLQLVHNHPDPLSATPATVILPAGTYRVVASSNGYGLITVPVVIAARQVTTVHLEGTASRPTSAPADAASTVRLPGGEVVGCRAATSAAH